MIWEQKKIAYIINDIPKKNNVLDSETKDSSTSFKAICKYLLGNTRKKQKIKFTPDTRKNSSKKIPGQKILGNILRYR